MVSTTMEGERRAMSRLPRSLWAALGSFTMTCRTWNSRVHALKLVKSNVIGNHKMLVALTF
jgi:hypothetical protein